MLSDEQLKLRQRRFGGSDANILMSGDPQKILTLWKEKTGQLEPIDFDGVWPVQLGLATEALNLRWFERKYGPISKIGHTIVAFDPAWAMCTLDAWSDHHKVPIECKHVAGREPYETVVARYQPQLQWQMHCCDARECALSVIIGANEPLVEFIPREVEYCEQLIERATLFMQHVLDGTPPVDIPMPPPPALMRKIYDMSQHPLWCEQADRWLQTHGAVEVAKEAEKVLKSLMPEDAKLAHGHRVKITRDRAGRLALREDN